MKKKILISALWVVAVWTLITSSAFATSYWKNHTKNNLQSIETSFSGSIAKTWKSQKRWKSNDIWLSSLLRSDITSVEKSEVRKITKEHQANISKIEYSTWSLQDKKTAIWIEQSSFVSLISKYIDKNQISEFDTYTNNMFNRSSKSMKLKHTKQILNKDI